MSQERPQQFLPTLLGCNVIDYGQGWAREIVMPDVMF